MPTNYAVSFLAFGCVLGGRFARLSLCRLSFPPSVPPLLLLLFAGESKPVALSLSLPLRRLTFRRQSLRSSVPPFVCLSVHLSICPSARLMPSGNLSSARGKTKEDLLNCEKNWQLAR